MNDRPAGKTAVPFSLHELEQAFLQEAMRIVSNRDLASRLAIDAMLEFIVHYRNGLLLEKR